MKNLLLIGHGVVGKAVHKGLSKNNVIDIVDKDQHEFTYAKAYDEWDGIILCLPTPQGPQGECDDFLVEQYIRVIRKKAPDVPILIKSTISVELVDLLEGDTSLTFNPEFLTEADSTDEFQNQSFVIFGGHQCRYWYEIFQQSGIWMGSVKFTDMKTAAYAKYTINSFLATKVIFFNELQSMFGEDGFDELTQIVSMDDRIGKSHMMVPGPDRQYGFGGMCFPKDTSAFTTSGKGKLSLLQKVIDINKELRNEIKK